MNKDSRIFVAGHRGMVGSAIVRALEERGYKHLITRTSAQLDLRDQPQVKELFEKERPEFVFLAAAKVGGIMANNTFRADFLYDNLMIEANVIHQAYLHKVKKLLFLGSSCIYPKLAPQPLKEEYLLTGELEQTNEPYAIAKITGIKLVESYRRQYGCNFISAMPTNLYGPNDNYDLNKSHVLPALLRKFHTAKAESLPEVQIWGTGTPLREFLHVDDLAEACLLMMDSYDEELFLNIGTGQDLSIKDLAEMIKDIVGYEGQLRFDTTKPDGTPRKLMDVSKIKAIGWSPRISLSDGIKKVYEEEVRHAVFVEQP
ncbi:MAG: GDP-L-fucose synthase [Bacteroidetes bacterium]|nr:GDP-L-fucose synthase [Bacteroidota bacterium]MDA0972771.1 GDP-L-fucose synthase [Bacteroidota bacterium]